MGVAALLLALYSLVVFSASPEWIAWQGPLVIGSLDVQTTDSGFPPPGDDPAATEGLLGLLAILSAGAALLLTSKRLTFPRPSAPMREAGPPRAPPPVAAPSDPATGGAPLSPAKPIAPPGGQG